MIDNEIRFDGTYKALKDQYSLYNKTVLVEFEAGVAAEELHFAPL